MVLTTLRSSYDDEGSMDTTPILAGNPVQPISSSESEVVSCSHIDALYRPMPDGCAHFHYDNVELSPITLAIVDVTTAVQQNGGAAHLDVTYKVQVSSSQNMWLVKRCYEDFRVLDKRLHECVYDSRRYTKLDLPELSENRDDMKTDLAHYLKRFSHLLAGDRINCVTILNWMEIDKHGNRLVIGDNSANNLAVVGAGPPKMIRAVFQKFGEVIQFLLCFFGRRPKKDDLKKRGIFRERVFGCDLEEHLRNTGQEVPRIMKVCTEYIEENGIEDGIYRRSGGASNKRRLINEFDSEHTPNLNKFSGDIHCVPDVCKAYFRELPDPLFTYQHYDAFMMTTVVDEETYLKHIHDTVQQLPPPHYRTLKYLINHLAKMAKMEDKTNMNTKNLAIVWAPNLLRSNENDSIALSSNDNTVKVVEYIIRNMDRIFNNVPGKLLAHQVI